MSWTFDSFYKCSQPLVFFIGINLVDVHVNLTSLISWEIHLLFLFITCISITILRCYVRCLCQQFLYSYSWILEFLLVEYFSLNQHLIVFKSRGNENMLHLGSFNQLFYMLLVFLHFLVILCLVVAMQPHVEQIPI